MNSLSFHQNSTLRAALTFSGKGSSVFGSDAHGFAYPLLNGSITKIFGWNNISMIIVNLMLIVSSLTVIWFYLKTSRKDKLWLSIFILLYPVTSMFCFTYMQETIHMFFAIILSVILFNLQYNTNKFIYKILFVIFITIAGLFRPLWFFFLLCLLPFSKNRKKLTAYIIAISLVLILSIMVILPHFFEYTPSKTSSFVKLLRYNEIGAALSLLVDNVKVNFIFFFNFDNMLLFYIRMLTLAVVMHFSILSFINRSKTSISISLICLTNLTLFFLLYDTIYLRDIRVLAPIFYFSAIFIVKSKLWFVKYLYLIFLLFLFEKSLPSTFLWINARSNYHDMEQFETQKKAYSQIAHVGSDELIYLGYIPKDLSTDLLVLPLTNTSGDQIRYIVPYYKIGVMPEEFHYLILKPMPNIFDGEKVLVSNEYYKLIKM